MTNAEPSLVKETGKSALLGGGIGAIGGIIGLIQGSIFGTFLTGAAIGALIPLIRRGIKKIFH